MPFSHRAFTLIELLVVISIISVLIGILLPALSSARLAAQNIDCLNRQRQIGIATQCYTNDNRGEMPPAKMDGIPSSDGAWPMLTVLEGPNALYAPYLHLNTSWNGPFMCQTYQNDGILPKAAIAGASVIKVSYTYNSYVGYGAPYNLKTIRISQVIGPSKSAYLVDGIYRNSTKIFYALMGANIGDGLTQPMNRHPNKSNNQLYFDGHASGIQGDDLIANRMALWQSFR